MQQETLPFVPKTAHAVLSECRRYRYVLYRSLDGLAWDAEERADSSARKTVCFVMLNPSVANEDDNDPTIEKLIKYGARWGFQRLSVVNVYALIETDSKVLRQALGKNAASLIIGDHNYAFLETELGNADQIVCGWGNEGAYRNDAIHDLLAEIGKPAFCFKRNRNGTPVHPLYQRDDAVLVSYTREPTPVPA